jgi:hypothetical protein
LVEEGEKIARGRDVMPLITDESPYFYESGTNDRIFEALRRIQEVKGPVTVRLVADEDISTVDRLRVRFEIGTSS